MKLRLLLVLLFFVDVVPSAAQNFTAVSGTITDPNGVPYANCAITAELVPTGNNPSINGAGISGLNRAGCDGNGSFNMNLGSNAVILPSGTQWKFTVTSNGAPPPLGTGPQFCIATVTISGSSQSISGNFSCPLLSRSGGTASQVLINQSVDAFNRTGSSLGANWTAYLNNFNITPGSVQGNTVTVLNVAAYTGVTSSPTQTARVSVGSLNAGTDFPGAAVRISGTPGTSVSYYVCDETTTSLLLQKVTGASNASAGTVTTLTSAAITGVAGDYIALSVIGNTLTCARNSSNSILEFNDSSSPLTSGFPGISMGGNVATISNFTFVNVGAPAGATKNIVFDGDSIIAANGNGSSNTDPATSFLYVPEVTAYVTNLGVSSKCVGITAAAPGGGNIESMLTTGTSVVDTLFVPGIKNILVIFGGTNDLFFSRTPAQAYADLTTYVAARHAAGWKVIIVPAVSRTATTTPALDAKEAILTSLILGNSAGADAVVPLPLSLIGPGASLNTNLFSADQTHLTEMAHIGILARAFSGVLSKF